jgi:hypothetical protein
MGVGRATRVILSSKRLEVCGFRGHRRAHSVRAARGAPGDEVNEKKEVGRTRTRTSERETRTRRRKRRREGEREGRRDGEGARDTTARIMGRAGVRSATRERRGREGGPILTSY